MPEPARPAEPALPEDLARRLESRPRPGRRRIAGALASLVLLLVLIGAGLPLLAGADWAQILAALSRLGAPLVLLAVLLGLLSLAAEAAGLHLMLPGSRLLRIAPAGAAATALGLAVPGGGLLGTGLLGWWLRREGLAASTIIIGLLGFSLADMAVSSVLVPLAGLVAYVLAGARLELPGTLAAGAVAVLGAAAVVGGIALVLSRPVLASVIERLAPLIPAAASALGIRDALMGLLRRRGAGLLGLLVASRLLQLLVLLAALRSLGADVPLAVVVAVFALGRMLALVPLTPGGAGITEAVSAAGLVALGVPGADAAAATLLLMVSTLLVPVLGGGIAAAAGALRPQRSSDGPSSSS
ncbi:lysylphosphatidylglycerol synthase domain-containing protein [Brachybacterium hainanense]|uniref:Lysylphosphatidylglycerol synthase domain-containing protein n=1 Tax=Brachybacterium hainanense TaxID=1541174 RepID=A0ABV6RIR5_9MICO